MSPTIGAPTSLWRLVGDALTLYFRPSPGHEIQLEPGAALVLSGEQIADFNFILLDGNPDPAGRLRALVRIIRARQLPALILVSAAIADEVAPAAGELGLAQVGSMPLMTHNGQDIAESAGEYSVTRVANPIELRTANSVMARAFSLPEETVQRAWGPGLLDSPGIDIFLAWRGHAPVATVTTFRQGATVGIWTMGTLPECQRQGAGYALLTHVMARHRAWGAHLFYLGATEAGYPLYARVGFRIEETMAVWALGDPTHAHG